MKKLFAILLALTSVFAFCACDGNTPKESSIFESLTEPFYFSSGAGAWRTVLNIHSDGSFEGAFSDSDMGEVGPGYPNGVVHYCDFSGRFIDPTKVNDYQYHLELEDLTMKDQPGEERIEDGTKYIAAEPYGMEKGTSFTLYLPGASATDMPEEFLSWSIAFGDWGRNKGTIPGYGLMNDTAGYGFFSEKSSSDYAVDGGQRSSNQAYADILNAHANNINALTTGKVGGTFLTDKNGSHTDLTVSFCDINGDGSDEMFFVEANESGSQIIPHVYTTVNGDAEEMRVDNSGVTDVKRYKNNDDVLFNAVAAGGSANLDYLVFLATDGAVYVVDREQDDMDNYFVRVYQAEGNTLVLRKIVSNLVHPNQDYSGTVDEYYINGEKVSFENGANEFKQLNNIYKNTIIYSGKFEDMSVMKKVNDSTNLAMNLNDAIIFLSK